MGKDTVSERENTLIPDANPAMGIDTIRVAAGINPSEISLTRDSRSLYMSLNGTTDQFKITDWSLADGSKVERVAFADGTVWTVPMMEAMTRGIASAASDSVYGSRDADVIDGLGGDDTMYGFEGEDILRGGVGADKLYGGSGADVLDGGAGNDILYGADGNDTYLMYRGMGQDKLEEGDATVGNLDTVEFAAGIAVSDVKIWRDSTNLYLGIKGTTDSMTVSSFWNVSTPLAYRIEQVRFADGTTWDLDTIMSKSYGLATEDADTLYGSEANDVLNGLGGNDVIDSANGDDVINGGAGDDLLMGSAGNDTLDGGTGNDSLQGGAGNDIYLMARGMGQDTVYEYDSTGTSIDRFQLAANINPADIRVLRDAYGSSLTLSISGTSDKLTMTHWGYGAQYQREQLEFADGTIWDASALAARARIATEAADIIHGDDLTETIDSLGGDDTVFAYGGDDLVNGRLGNDSLNGGSGNDALYGGAGNDVVSGDTGNDSLWGNDGDDSLRGGAGDDVLVGGVGVDYLSGDAGNDTYMFARGDGSDLIFENDATAGNVDTAQFASGVSADQLWFRQVGSDLEVSVIGTTDKATIGNWYSGSAYHLEKIKTNDGKVLLDSQVQSLVQAMASFSPPAAGQTTLPANYESSLGTVIAANWH